MDDLVLMLNGAMAAEGKVGLKMNVRGRTWTRCWRCWSTRARRSTAPTVSPLTDPDWVA